MRFREWLALTYPDVRLNQWQQAMVAVLESGDLHTYGLTPGRRFGKTFLFDLWMEYLETS